MSNLVLGYAGNYHFYIYERFLSSLRRAMPDTEVVLFIEPRDQLIAAPIFEKYRANYVVTERLFNPVLYRFILYFQFFQNFPQKFVDNLILLTDVRDVIFQKDPYTYWEHVDFDLAVFEEKKNIGQCPANSDWMKRLFGQQIFNEMADNQIICAGTTIGNYKAIQAYLNLMNQKCAEFMRGGDTSYGIDQAVHNVIFYKKLLDPLRVKAFDNENGPVSTLQYSNKLINVDGFIINDNLEVACLAHQVDRFSSEQLEVLGEKQDLPVFDLILQSKEIYK